MSTFRRQFRIWLLALLAACGSGGTPQTPTPNFAAAVAMPDRDSAAIAASILGQGGNAVDAAIASAFALAVTFPEAGNIGGGGFMMIYFDGEAAFLDYREVAPAAADRDMYLDAEGNVIAGLSVVGHRAVGVPGTVAGLWAAHQRYGTLDWEALVAPAIELAADGFAVHPLLAERIAAGAPSFAAQTNFAAHFGHARADEVFVQAELAATLSRIAANGRDGFYRGETAALLTAEMRRGGGLVTSADLATYAPVWREPLRAEWRDQEVLAAPLPSSGGIALIQLLKMKQHLAAAFTGLERNSAQYIHLIAEMEKRVFADRAEYLGDPEFVAVPVERLLDNAYIAARADEVDPERISTLDSVRPGLEGTATTHFSILDRLGNAVSNTYTLNTDFGSGVVVEGAGFLLNNEMDDFSAKPGAPNFFGALGNAANAVEPGKRMLSSMSPTVLLHDGEVSMVVGTPGGPSIFTSVFQAINNVFDYHLSAAQAASAPRFHHQLVPPEEIFYTVAHPLDAAVIAEMSSRGYYFTQRDFGDLQIIRRNGELLEAGSDDSQRGESRVIR